MNTDMQQPPHNNESQQSVRDRVFSTIEAQKVEPRSKYLFWCENTSVWLVWLATVLLGGLATAVLIFTSTYRYYDIYEDRHENFVTFFLEALPVLWVLAFIGLMYVAVRGLRATKRGYRLSPWLVGGSSIGVSLLLGCVGSMNGFGFLVDQALGEFAPMYYSQAERDELLWQQPNEGRLVGVYVSDLPDQEQYVFFTDITGKEWTVFVGELFTRDRELLKQGIKVRLLGVPTELDYVGYYHACGVFPWMLDRQRPMKELSAGRQAYIENMHAHSRTPADQLRELEQVAFGNARADNVPSMRICAEIAAVRQISQRMQ